MAYQSARDTSLDEGMGTGLEMRDSGELTQGFVAVDVCIWKRCVHM
jgi:hypothetical protein